MYMLKCTQIQPQFPKMVVLGPGLTSVERNTEDTEFKEVLILRVDLPLA